MLNLHIFKLIFLFLIDSKKMATSFARADVPDPNKILDFVETSTSSVAAVFEVNIDCNIQANIVIKPNN